MRKSLLLDSLFPATRQAVLALTMMHPENWLYMSDLARQIGCRPSSLQRELEQLVKSGVLLRRVDGNRVYFKPDPACPVFSELRSLMLKTAGLADVLRDLLKPFAHRIDLAFVFGSIARASETSASDIDFMVIGKIGLAELAGNIRKAEDRLGRPVNPVIYSLLEFKDKAGQDHYFVKNVLKQEKIFIFGSADDLAAIIGPKQDSAPRRQLAGTERSSGSRRA